MVIGLSLAAVAWAISLLIARAVSSNPSVYWMWGMLGPILVLAFIASNMLDLSYAITHRNPE